MATDDTPIPAPQTSAQEEPSFDLSITNGAAKKLQALMDLYEIQTAKDAVGMALELLDAVQGAKDIIVRSNDGTMKVLKVSPPSHGKQQQQAQGQA